MSKFFLISLSLAFFSASCAGISQPASSIQVKQSHLNSVASARKTACVSFQGNGVYFSSHVGALISLLENNYEPVFATGGSSGAILAGVSRALVENPSLEAADGRFAPTLGAMLLAASSPVIESVLFLPRFTTPLSLLDSFDVFLSGSAFGVLRADPADALVHAESIVGQSALVIDFYRSVDFSRVVATSNLAERERIVAALWKSFVNAIEVHPDDFTDAIFVPRAQLIAEGRSRLVEIQDRFFKLYRSKQDTLLTNFKTRQENWNSFLEGNGKNFGLGEQEKRRALMKRILTAARTIESFDSLAATLSGDFLLVDPDRVYRAFDGFDSRTGRPMEIPSNTVLHTTARRALRKNGDWAEVSGLDSLHQVYFTNPVQAPLAAEVLLRPENNPLQPSNRSQLPVIPSTRLSVTSQKLGPALAASTGEPTAFVRFPIQLDAAAAQRFEWLSPHEQLIGSGGWLEKVSLGTAKQFEQCAAQNVDLYFYTSDGDGVNRFAKMVFLGLFLDKPLRGLLAKQIGNPSVDIRAALAGAGAQGNTFEPPAAARSMFEKMISSADSLFSETRDVKARFGNLPVNFNYVNPSVSFGSKSDSLDTVFRSNRRAMILAAYEFTRHLVGQKGLGRANLPLWNKRLESVLTLRTPTDVLAVIDSTMPRISLTEEFYSPQE